MQERVREASVKIGDRIEPNKGAAIATADEWQGCSALRKGGNTGDVKSTRARTPDFNPSSASY